MLCHWDFGIVCATTLCYRSAEKVIDTPVTSQLYAFTRAKGIENFTFEILEQCPAAELNEKEKTYIEMYQTYEFGLNKTKGNK